MIGFLKAGDPGAPGILAFFYANAMTITQPITVLAITFLLVLHGRDYAEQPPECGRAVK